LTEKGQEVEAVMNFETLEKQAKKVRSPGWDEKELDALAMTYSTGVVMFSV